MKNILFFLLLFFAMQNYLIAQDEHYNFKVDDDKNVIWQKVYPSNIGNERMIDFFITSGEIENIAQAKNRITGNLVGADPDFKAAGVGSFFAPDWIKSKSISCFVVIEFMNDNYRVTLKKIILTQTKSTFVRKKGTEEELADWAMKMGKSEFSGFFKKDGGKIYDATFEKLFTIDESEIYLLAETNNEVEREEIPDPISRISDVDANIPINKTSNKNSFAVIIGNENYENEIPVKYAINDAQTVKEYAINTLGIPEKQVHYKKDATFTTMLDEIEWLNNIAKAFENEARIIFYYAGHGMPDEATKSSYLLPVNGTSSRTRTAIKVDELYAKLTEHPTKQVTVILDACFSGSSRNGMIATGRGVKVKPKDNLLQGNLVVFSAVSGDETAHPYDEKQHGVFTYFLLKKLKETNGNISYKDLSDYITTEVTRLSVINNKEQNPWINASDDIESEWENWRFR